MLRCILAAFALAASSLAALGQAWPDKPVKIIVPYAAGGGTDLVARVLAERFGDTFGQRFFVENRGGASGMIGTDAVAKSAPDGYTLLVATPAEIAINPHIFPRVAYDAQKDLAPVTLLAVTPLVIAAHPGLNIASPADLLALLKAKPDSLSYSTPGVGTSHHLAGEFLKKVAKVDMRHVPYRGAGPAVQDAIGGQVPLTFSGMPPVVEHVKAGTLKAVAVTSAERSPIFPNVVALAELGPEYKDFDITNWFGLLAPAAVPKDIVGKLHAAAVKALGEASVRQKIGDQGAEPVGNTPEAFAAFIRSESDKYARIGAATGVKVQP